MISFIVRVQGVSYWEGNDEGGGGNGVFTPAEDAENCDVWVSYIIAALTCEKNIFDMKLIQ